MHRRRVFLLAVTPLIAVACGGGDNGDGDPVAAPPATAAATATNATVAPPATGAEVEVPDAVLTDVASGEEVNLRSLVPSEKPVLFWFWAPH